MRSGEIHHPLGKFMSCRRGATAVEFSLLASPFVFLLVGIIQFFMLQFMQSTLSDALYSSASNPEPELLAGQKTGYQAILCNKTAFPTMCKTNLKLEMQPLSTAPTGATAITGATFSAGSSNDMLVLRASSTVDQLLPFIPVLTAKASVIFRRPL